MSYTKFRKQSNLTCFTQLECIYLFQSRVVSLLWISAFNSYDQSSNPPQVFRFLCKICVWKEAGIAPILCRQSNNVLWLVKTCHTTSNHEALFQSRVNTILWHTPLWLVETCHKISNHNALFQTIVNISLWLVETCHTTSNHEALFQSKVVIGISVTRLGNFCILGNHSKPVATIILPKLPTLLGNFCKGVKIIHYSCEIIFGQLLCTFGNFYLVTLLRRCVQP